jgi:hypothetical protein
VQQLPKQMSSTAEPIVYRLVPEGQGGTLWFNWSSEPDHRENVDYVGTELWEHNVGVFFKINHRKSFCANVDVLSEIKYPKNLIANKEGFELQQEFLEFLQDHGHTEDWDFPDPDFVKFSSSYAQILIMLPQMGICITVSADSL